MSDKLLAERYMILEKVGEGGMAYVYKGKDTLLNRFVAIKVLKPEFTQNEKFVENFLKESQAAAGLICPNIVGVYDVGHEGRVHYIVMELVTGETLSDIIEKKGKLEYKEAINIAKQILNALSVAHSHQIIHRDVKPHNIIITEDGTAKLADFGIARAVSEESIKEGNEEVMGSVHYFSPEQARGAYIDERSDIYSLGIVLYEMLTGEVPFDGDTAVSVALKHINEPIPRILMKEPGLPPKLAKIIDKATEKPQSKRYESASDMIKDLEAIEYVSNIMGQKNYESHKAKEESDDKEALKKEKKNKKAKDKGEKKQNKDKMNKSTNIIALIAVIIIVLIGIGIFGAFSGWFSNNKVVEVPSFIGKTYDEALIVAKEKGLNLIKGNDVYSQVQDEGLIDSQTPSEKTEVKVGGDVTVFVSKGKKNNVVPNVLGKSQEEARLMLENSGFTLGEVTFMDSTQEKDTVIDQSIAAGSTYKSGQPIDIVISSGGGENLVSMDYLIGMDFDSAKAKIESLELVVGNITYEETKSQESNIVLWQSVKAGYEVKKGDSIDLKLSKAPEVASEGGEG